jgi:D-lactate dehydrogenase (cytochrome)
VATKPHDNERAKAFSEQIVRRALAVGGTASGEHGIGLAKRAYMDEEHGAALPWMRRIKALFDPEGLLNPGKIV